MQGNWYNPNGFWAFFDNDGNIVASDYSGERRVGVTLAKFNKMEKLANETMGIAEQHKAKEEEYRAILEEKGIIPKELTPDEKIAALSDQVNQLTQIVREFAEREKAQDKKKAMTPEVLPPEKGRGK